MQPYMGCDVGVEGYSTLGRRMKRLPRVAIKLTRAHVHVNGKIQKGIVHRLKGLALIIQKD
jgi:hypothetical protein